MKLINRSKDQYLLASDTGDSVMRFRVRPESDRESPDRCAMVDVDDISYAHLVLFRVGPESSGRYSFAQFDTYQDLLDFEANCAASIVGQQDDFKLTRVWESPARTVEQRAWVEQMLASKNRPTALEVGVW